MSKIEANVEFQVEKDDTTGLFSWEVTVSAKEYETKEEAVANMSVVLEKLGVSGEDLDEEG